MQVNTSAEESKFGLPPEELAGFLRSHPILRDVEVQGLMTLALFTPTPTGCGECFGPCARSATG